MDEYALARDLADVADEISMKYFARNPEKFFKQDGTVVTHADREIELALRETISAWFPDHALLGEEQGLQGDPSGPIWVIDPIDGTANFADGIPIFATLIGFRVDGQTLAAVVSAPAIGERYQAAIGEGASMNGEPIHVSEVAKLGEASVCFGSLRRMVRNGYGPQAQSILAGCKRDRGLGDFWGHMLVARGAMDAMIEPNLAPWDVLPLEVIVAEAGGRLSNFAGDAYPEAKIANVKAGDGSCLTTNGSIHAELLGELSPRQQA